jgi:hypothetical protein
LRGKRLRRGGFFLLKLANLLDWRIAGWPRCLAFQEPIEAARLLNLAIDRSSTASGMTMLGSH